MHHVVFFTKGGQRHLFSVKRELIMNICVLVLPDYGPLTTGASDRHVTVVGIHVYKRH